MQLTPKEKAKELVNKFTKFHTNGVYSAVHIEVAKQFAIIAVDEIIEAIDWHKFETPNKELEYWQEVKQEIEKL